MNYKCKGIRVCKEAHVCKDSPFFTTKKINEKPIDLPDNSLLRKRVSSSNTEEEAKFLSWFNKLTPKEKNAALKRKMIQIINHGYKL